MRARVASKAGQSSTVVLRDQKWPLQSFAYCNEHDSTGSILVPIDWLSLQYAVGSVTLHAAHNPPKGHATARHVIRPGVCRCWQPTRPRAGAPRLSLGDGCRRCRKWGCWWLTAGDDERMNKRRRINHTLNGDTRKMCRPVDLSSAERRIVTGAAVVAAVGTAASRGALLPLPAPPQPPPPPPPPPPLPRARSPQPPPPPPPLPPLPRAPAPATGLSVGWTGAQGRSRGMSSSSFTVK